MNLKTQFMTGDFFYSGRELAPHYLLSQHRLEGPYLVAFQGGCRVETDHLVDWEDRLVNDRIEAKSMVHFLGEFFGIGLRESVVLQRLLMSTMGEVLTPLLKENHRNQFQRSGDDLFIGDRKLTVSIVTASPVSTLLHAAVNIDPTGAPVKAIGLLELEVDPAAFSAQVLKQIEQEWSSIERACTKVRPVI